MITTQPGVERAKSHTQRNLTILLLAGPGGGVDAILISGIQVLTGAQTDGRRQTSWFCALPIAR